MKALDSISQQCLWKVLEKCGIESHHINLLRRLFAEENGTVSTDKESDMFEMKRGTKQGDPLSSLLFNTVLQKALKGVVVRWQKSKCIGTRLGGYESDCSQTGVLLTTCSCSLLHRRSSQNDVCLQTTHREGGSEDPLGKYENCHQSKFEHLKRNGDQQHQSGCIAGERVWQVSRTNNKISATGNNKKHRLRLFNMVISPTLSYASGTWTLTKEHERMIRTTQRKMLRLNCTNEKEVQEEDTETQRRKIIRGPKIPCWIETHRRMKWRLAVRIASLPDKRWTKTTAKWNPVLGPKHQTNRPVERPKKRWEDEINEFLKPEETEETKGNETKNNDTWIKVAKRTERWQFGVWLVRGAHGQRPGRPTFWCGCHRRKTRHGLVNNMKQIVCCSIAPWRSFQVAVFNLNVMRRSVMEHL